MKNKSKCYLPKMRTNYHPSNSECQTSPTSYKTKKIPNPANNPIVVNNIAWQEFDYTENLLDSE